MITDEVVATVPFVISLVIHFYIIPIGEYQGTCEPIRKAYVHQIAAGRTSPELRDPLLSKASGPSLWFLTL